MEEDTSMLISFQVEDALKILHAHDVDVPPSGCIGRFEKDVTTALCDVVGLELEDVPALLLSAAESKEKDKILQQVAKGVRDMRKFYEVVCNTGLAVCIMIQKDPDNSNFPPSIKKFAPLLGYNKSGKACEKKIRENNEQFLKILCKLETILAPYLPDEPDNTPPKEKRTTKSYREILNEVPDAAVTNAKGTSSNINAATGSATGATTGTGTGTATDSTTSATTGTGIGTATGTTTDETTRTATDTTTGAVTSVTTGVSGSAESTTPGTVDGQAATDGNGASGSSSGTGSASPVSTVSPTSGSDQVSSSDGTEQRADPKGDVDTTQPKRGGIPNHEGSTLVYEGEIHETEINLAAHCKSCSEYESCLARATTKDRRITLGLKFSVWAKAYEIGVVTCPKTGEKVEGTHPENIRGRTQYDVNFMTLVLTLFCVGFVSISRIVAILKDCFGMKISTGTVSNFIHRAGEQGVAYWDYIRLKVREAALAFADETSAQVQAKGEAIRRWVHTVVTDSYTYLYCSEYRGFKAILGDGILVDFFGSLCHDCWSAYFNLAKDKVKHVLCGAHLVRELWGVLNSDPTQTWVADMYALLKEMLAKKRELLQRGLDMGLSKKLDASVLFPQCTPAELASFKQRYLDIVRRGFEINGESFEGGKRGSRKKKQTKAVNLLVRLRDYMDEWLAFIIDVRIPFTNNDAETSLRGLKVWQHISHVMGNDEGLVIRCILLSIVQSARKQGRSAHEALFAVLQGVPPEEFFGELVSQEIRDSAPSRTESAMVLRSMKKDQETKAANS